MSAGARFTVTRCSGNRYPEFLMALRTRSRLSRTLASGRPTIVKTGNPSDTSTSTTTVKASTESTAALRRIASTEPLLQDRRLGGYRKNSVQILLLQQTLVFTSQELRCGGRQLVASSLTCAARRW